MQTFNFSTALNALKEGYRAKREGWNGKDQYVFLKNAKGQMRAYFVLKTAQGDYSTWVPSVSDCLAEDWVVLAKGDNEKVTDGNKSNEKVTECPASRNDNKKEEAKKLFDELEELLHLLFDF